MSEVESSGWQRDLALIADAARQAGNVALEYFRRSPEVWWKNEGRSPVSAADFAANEALESMLRSARPDYGWLSEETEDGDDRLSRETLFVVDPIDGTRAFLAGLDTWCVSVAVVHRGRPVAGVLNAPALEEAYSAVEGGQALKNEAPVTVSQRQPGEVCRLAAAEDVVASFAPDFRRQVERAKHIPSLAYRLAMVADGRLEGTFVKPNSHDWDLAAADLILECAGGHLVDLVGNRLVYNKPDVSHRSLCGASASSLPEILLQLTSRRAS
ncbi:3'(2'),5'-bisphosphate nucleotidase CysQ [Rhizobium sp. BK251]|uniref:3'(2'),5'-bisphosphate nucleotidase CysQ n=1 Tax=Rhizobium sp. BK251 TaxID=2512125 RepID=UPI00104A3994|nr:3'(2'),5'-bisphosphate nucleotidase CysQ [Rhizobium sp. BK251]TCL75822.1 myo-inositol-1(or 4)-monophosphatase [Rhizobium sp. BK251]